MLVAAVQSGESVVGAARRLGVGESTAYRWVKLSREKTAPKPTPRFVELMPAAALQGSVVVRVAQIEIEVRPGFDASLLREVVCALEGGPA